MKRVLVSAVLIAAVVVGAGCGGDDSVSEAELKLAEMKAGETARLKERLRIKNKQLKDARRAKKQSSGSGSAAPVATAPVSSGGSGGGDVPSYREYCGDGVYASGSASCGFADNIASAYRYSPSSTLYDIYSPATGLEYTVSCSGGSVVTCTGGKAAVVYLK